MLQKLVSAVSIGVLAFSMACTNKKVQNPIADVGSKQPDKILFDRAMDAMKHNRFDVARLTLQTLINTYPDSEFIARAKLAVGDSWYAEGGSAALIQAENEYKDFETFFPNMPEAAEAQLKIADIHYRQMEKADRDFTHAKRAEDEYRQLILQYPDSKLVPTAKKRLLQVQEVLAEREFMIGRFYFMRESYNASQARLKSLVDTYPLFSGADEALYMLGQIDEKMIEKIRAVPSSEKFSEAQKGAVIKKLTDQAASNYSKIITRYPMMTRVEDAKKRLAELQRPIPTPTAEAIALNKKEEEGRGETGMVGKVMEKFHKGPDVAQAPAYVPGIEPTLVEPKPTNAPDIARQNASMLASAMASSGKGGTGSVNVDVVGKDGTPGPNAPVPRSDNPTDGTPPPAQNQQQSPNDIPELTPLPNAGGDAQQQQPVAAPAQVNEAQQPASDQQASDASSSSSSTSADSGKKDQQESSSKSKKKKGLKKLNPF